ncbi:unnamed protein product [Anisakis simplex]|uniref:Uncharacterized protein n=1 Tax=Anisakis simplex TaxID=6269 RepID=A0A3P6P1B4_ANISI|nr:unnamed protein product [Anisakis simplex]
MQDYKPPVVPNEAEYQEWQEINFNGSTAMLRTDVTLTAEMVNEHFPPFNVLQADHKVGASFRRLHASSGPEISFQISC